MSEHDTPDPVDKAYVQAEAMLDDQAARAARRAKVLGAVAADTEAQAASPQAPPRRRGWGLPGGPGGWLAAASVAGLAVLLAVRANQVRIAEPPVAPPSVAVAPPVVREAAPENAPQASPPAATVAAPPPAPQAASEPARETAAPPVAAAPAPVPAAPPAPLARAEARPMSDALAPPPPPPPPPPAPALAAPRAVAGAAPFPAEAPEDVVVTASRVGGATAPQGRAPSAAKAAPVSPSTLATRLRAAAAAGRTEEVRALLDQGAVVDAQDAAGETALMQAVRNRRAAVAALLRDRGADVDLANLSGDSARDLAGLSRDPALIRALRLTP